MEKKNQYFPQSLPYPGKTLAEKLVEMSIDTKEFAVRTGKPEKTISAVLNGKSAITPEMAVLFEKTTMIPAHFWLNSQQNYDEFMARKKNKKIMVRKFSNHTLWKGEHVEWRRQDTLSG